MSEGTERIKNAVELDVHSQRRPQSGDFQLTWRHLNYTVNNSLITRISRRIQGFKNTPKTKRILEDVSGEINSGELVAFMGPSGAGKSTLMECVVGRRVKGKSGDVFVSGGNIHNLKVSFIAQRNNFLSQLTVRETIMFAARIQMATRSSEGTADSLFEGTDEKIFTKPGSYEYCSILTDTVIKNLGLEACAHNRVTRCSGGQQKRVAIAQELVGKPNILVLDEPTSGLDSASCLQVVEGLRKLSEQNIAVLATIHQPSVKVLNLFHKVYVLSANGDCIFEDSPTLLVDELRFQGLSCPDLYNPADFIMEVACGEHDNSVVDFLVDKHRKKYDQMSIIAENRKTLTDLNHEDLYPFWSHIWVLFLRFNLVTLRDPYVFAFRMATTFAVPLFLTSLYGNQIGIRGGCPPKFDAEFEPSQLDYIGNEIEAEIKTTYNNIGNVFFCVMFVMFNALMPTCVGFPKEMIAFKTEKHNHWYSTKAFFFAKIASELPLQFVSIILYWPIAHFIQNQYPEIWRVAVICFLMFLTQLIAQTYGYIIGALFMFNIPASIYQGPSVCMLPFILISGAFIKVKNMSPFFERLSYLSYLRFSMEGMLVALYGFGRCESGKTDLKEGREAFVVWMSAMLGLYEESDPTALTNSHDNVTGTASETFVQELIDSISGDFISEKNVVRSLVMNKFDLEEWYVQRAFVYLIIYTVIIRCVAYLVISIKVKAKN